MHGSRSYRGGIQVKGAGPFLDRTGLDLRSGSQEKSCGVGLRGFESHPPHQFISHDPELNLLSEVSS